VIVVAEIPAQLETYLDWLVETLDGTTDLTAAYLIGSAARGAYVHGRSDVDVIAVTAHPLTLDEKRAIVAAAEALPSPARKLELVVYAAGSHRWELNLNTGEHASFDPSEEPPFWFVLDRAIAEQDVVVLAGPPWHELFEPVERDAVLAALEEAIDWQEREQPLEAGSILNALRAWAWLETGRWVSKPYAAAWLRQRVRAAIREAR
jgi:predicted nucleotidyltransferase